MIRRIEEHPVWIGTKTLGNGSSVYDRSRETPTAAYTTEGLRRRRTVLRAAGAIARVFSGLLIVIYRRTRVVICPVSRDLSDDPPTKSRYSPSGCFQASFTVS